MLLTTLAACFVRSRFPFLLSLSLLFFIWGGLSLEPFLKPAADLSLFASEQPVTIEGVVDERPEGNATGGARVYLQVARLCREESETAVTGRLLVQVKEGRPQLYTGDRILFVSKIRKPRTYGLPGESDYPRRLAYKKVFATAFVKEADDILLVRAGEGWRHRIDLLAASLGRFITGHAPGAEGGVLKALLLGDKGDVPEELNDAYARSGVNHILSISGFHVGIIFLCVFQLLLLLARGSEFLALRLNLRKALLLAALPVAVFYLFLSGCAPATLRSVLMIAAFVASLQLKREAQPVNSVLLAACIILFLAPETLFEVSFQLSFLAIWGLVALAPPLAALFAGTGRALRWLLLLLAASAAAILATLVPVAYYFHRVSFIGLIANLIIVPFMGYGAVIAGFVSLPLGFIAPVPAQALIHLAAFLVRLSDAAILYLARAPVLSGYAPTCLDLLLSYLVLCAITFLRTRQLRLLSVLFLLLVLCVRAVPAAGVGDGLMHVYFLSVGQGDAALVGLPDGKWMLVDGGGKAGESEARAGERLLLPALRSLGVRRIDYLVLSHEHPDHMQGVLYLAEKFEVGEFWESGVHSALREYQQLKWVLAMRDIPVRVVNASNPPFAAGGAFVEPLWPPRDIAAADSGRIDSGRGDSWDSSVGEGHSWETPTPDNSRTTSFGDSSARGDIGFRDSSRESSRGNRSWDANESSLVFRLRHGSSSVLFTGDLGAKSERELLARGVPLHCTLLKVGHHGSKYSSSDAFLVAVSPKGAVISAGYDNPFHLPAPSTVRRLQKLGIRVYRTDLDGTIKAVCRPDGGFTVSTPWGHFN